VAASEDSTTSLTGGAVPERIWAALAADPRRALETGLSPADLNTLLIGTTHVRSEAVSAQRLMQRWREDAYVLPAAVDPRRLAAVEAALWQHLPDDVDGLELSPVAPLGVVSGLGSVGQNRVLATIRGTEVVSDPTNVLALEAARRRLDGTEEPIHLAACHRVLRLQRFEPPYGQHFKLFALVSSARDVGSGRAEAALVERHLRFYATALSALLPQRRIQLRHSCYDGTAEGQRILDSALAGLTDLPTNVDLVPEPGREHGRGYYRQVSVGVRILDQGTELDIGDGGLTDWTAKLTSNAKERCLISCVSAERIAALQTS
jgi:hypothetical protein